MRARGHIARAHRPMGRAARAGLVSAALVLAALMLASTAFASSATVYVAAGGDDGAGANTCASASSPCASVTHALSEVSAGGTVYVAGTLDVFDPATDAGDENGITVAQDVTIAQDPGGASAVIVGTGSTVAPNSLLTVSGAHMVYLNGLTFEHGNASMHRGGAISNNDGGTLTVTGCTFTDNGSAERFESAGGGAIDNADQATGTLMVSDSTFTGNETGEDGGAIDNADNGGAGTATIGNSTFTGNSDTHNNGGAINNADNGGTGVMTITGSTFDANTDTANGGAIDNGNDSGTGTLMVSSSAFDGNSAYDGGAIDNGNDGNGYHDPSGMGTLTVRNSTFVDNIASHYDGGAIDIGDMGGTARATVQGSTFTGNQAAQRDGGAIDNGDSGGHGTLSVTSSTFSGNSAPHADGGAIDNGDLGGTGTATVQDSTFNANTATQAGAVGNGDSTGGQGTLTLVADTFAADANQNTDTGDEISSATHGPGIVYAAADLFDGDCTGNGSGWTDAGYNASTSASCLGSVPAASDGPVSALIGSRLASLAANGSATSTILMRADDPAVGLIPAAAPAVTLGGTQYQLCPTTDQRGYTNVTGAACNPGATQLAVPVIDASLSSSGQRSGAGWWSAPVTVTFTCTTVVALTSDCPAPATLNADAAGQSVTRSITGIDDVGGDSVTESGINIDQRAPSVTITGPANGLLYRVPPPAPACTASGGVSGIASCSLSTTTTKTATGYAETVVGTATSEAGIQHSASISFTVDEVPSVKITGPIAGATYLGSAPRARCVATATASPVRYCSLHRRMTRLSNGFRERLTAKAVSRSGQTATARKSFIVQTSTLPSFVGQRRHRGQSYVLRVGRRYKIVVASRQRPRYVYAAQAPGRPAGGNVPFHRAGSRGGLPRWKFVVRLPNYLAYFPVWNVGVRIGAHLDIITLFV